MMQLTIIRRVGISLGVINKLMIEESKHPEFAGILRRVWNQDTHTQAGANVWNKQSTAEGHQ